jgi:organic hydroperoxide reductase OsmC/OhrA
LPRVPPVHRYHVRASWNGSTGAGYRGYDRSHRVVTTPATLDLDVSADPAFRGDPALVNPEQLVVVAASSCQLMSFLAAAALAHVDVVEYEDDAEAEMPEERPIRITRITLRPRIVVRGDVTEERIRELVEIGHHECFIANSLNSEIVVEPAIEIVP